jgi:hypothetical protein
MLSSFGPNDVGPFGRGFVNSLRSSAQYTGPAIAMLTFPIHGEAGCGAVHNEISRRSAAIMSLKFESQSNKDDESSVNRPRSHSKVSASNDRTSAAHHGNDEDLAGVNKVGIPDLVPVCPVHDRVARAVAIGDAADAPQAVAGGYHPSQISGCKRPR